MRGIQSNLDKLHEAGIRPVAISTDAPEVSRELREKSGLTFTFLADPQLEAIRRFDLVHAGAGEEGRDISRPAEFLIDSSGTVRWVNLTENYWIRARADQILEAARTIK